jgi:signal transduction histidine kinase
VTELAGALLGWQLGASAAAAILMVRWWRRRAALNEALHELRRPLQALTLAAMPGERTSARLDSSLRLATAALDRLDREINGWAEDPPAEAVAVSPLVRAAVERWRGRADLAGATLALRGGGIEAVVVGDRVLLSQAIDNLIVNAIEHGGGTIFVELSTRAGRVRIAVADSGGSRGGTFGGRPGLRSRIAGRRRRGHGLAVVRTVAARHGGRFALHRSARGSRAVLELPVDAPVPTPR